MTLTKCHIENDTVTGYRVALGTLVVSISRLTPTNILRICYDSCIYILYDAQVQYYYVVIMIEYQVRRD